MNHLKTLLLTFRLGDCLEKPNQMTGGRSGHLIWKVPTDTGLYAIKQLAPDIDITNDENKRKYELSESIAHQFASKNIPACTALSNNNKYLTIIDRNGYLIYRYIDGHTLKRDQVSMTHAIRASELIARMHCCDLKVDNVKQPRFDIHSNDTIRDACQKINAKNPNISAILKENMDCIITVNNSYYSSIDALKNKSVITHGDMDQLNILWDDSENPHIIDWESARRMNPTFEIARSALGWAGMGGNTFDKSVFDKMLSTYIEAGGNLDTSILKEALTGVYGSLINWLLFNVNISLSSQDANQINVAEMELSWAISTLLRLQHHMPNLYEFIDF